MLRLMMRFLLISLCCLLLVSCKSYTIAGVEKSNVQEATIRNTYFSNPETDYVYKAHIEVYGNDLSGIFVVKKINDSLHRVVLTTDFGNKLLDFELSETEFKVNYIVADLNRKIIINTLRNDFRLLLKNQYSVSATFEDELSLVYKSEAGNRNNFVRVTKNDRSLVEIIHAGKTKEKVVIRFTPKNSTFAESIFIQHYNIKLKIQFNQITN